MFRKLLNLLSDVAVYGVSSLLSQLIGFFLLPLYTRYLTPADQGTVYMVTAVTAFFGPLANIGMINAIFRRFNLDKDERTRGQVLTTGLISVTISSLTVLAIASVFAESISRLAVGDESATAIVRLSLLTAAVSTIGQVPLAILRAERRVKTTAMVNVSRLLISVACTIWLVVVREQGVWGVVAGALSGDAVVTGVLFAITFRSFRFLGTMATWKRLAAYGMPFVPHQLQSVAMGILAQYAVGKYLGLEQAGLYGMAIKFTLPIGFVVAAVQNAWTAYKFQIHADDEDPEAFFRTTVTYYVAGLMYLWVGVSFWGPEMVWLLTTEGYHPAAALIAVCGLIPVSQGIYFMLGTGIELSEKTGAIPLVTLTGLVTAAISAVVLIPRLGAAGAALTTTNAFIALTIVIYVLSQRRVPIRYDWPALIKLLALGMAAVMIGHLALAWPASQRIAMAVTISLVFPLVEFAILSRSPTERHRMRILWNKVSRRGSVHAASQSLAEVPQISRMSEIPGMEATNSLVLDPDEPGWDGALDQERSEFLPNPAAHTLPRRYNTDDSEN